ncbi:hypothetical protein NXC24_PB00085 (plasmid) [Rhizobium sp. NXC24]|nr:hypothetical protein NXC24_PB00085 [Rhizobium sp. NXC24]
MSVRFGFQRSRHAGFEASGHECLSCNDGGYAAIEGTATGLDGTLMAFAITQWPLVFEKIQSVVYARKRPLKTTLKSDSDQTSPGNIGHRHPIFLPMSPVVIQQILE